MKLTMERDSACFHVKLFYYPGVSDKYEAVRIVWDSFELNSLRRARRRYARLKQQILCGMIPRIYYSKISYVR